MNEILAIDIGGTNVKAGMFSRRGELIAREELPVDRFEVAGGPEALVETLKALVGEAGLGAGEVAGVGVDVPGPVDDRGNASALPNCALDVANLLKALSGAFPEAAFALANDACAAAAGELWKGAGGRRSSFMLVAIGTGVGAGTVVDGKVVKGAFGAAGEIGHMCVNRHETEECGCGRRGCLEQYASATGIVRAYRAECARTGVRPARLTGPTDTLSVFAAARAGDDAAQAAISLMCEHLGFAIAQAALVADPGLFLIGGGVSAGFDLFSDRLRAAFRKYALPQLAATRIEQASLGNEAALYGSAFLALRDSTLNHR